MMEDKKKWVVQKYFALPILKLSIEARTYLPLAEFIIPISARG
jgi:hypothetical protein